MTIKEQFATADQRDLFFLIGVWDYLCTQERNYDWLIFGFVQLKYELAAELRSFFNAAKHIPTKTAGKRTSCRAGAKLCVK